MFTSVYIFVFTLRNIMTVLGQNLEGYHVCLLINVSVDQRYLRIMFIPAASVNACVSFIQLNPNPMPNV